MKYKQKYDSLKFFLQIIKANIKTHVFFNMKKSIKRDISLRRLTFVLISFNTFAL